MALTAREALDTQAARRLTVERTDQGWITRLPGSNNRVRVSPAVTQEAAIEAAEGFLAAREADMATRDARELIAQMQRGEHFHRPRTEKDPETGESAVVFDLLAAVDESVVVSGAGSVVEAWTAERLGSGSAGGAGGPAPHGTGLEEPA